MPFKIAALFAYLYNINIMTRRRARYNKAEKISRKINKQKEKNNLLLPLKNKIKIFLIIFTNGLKIVDSARQIVYYK